MSSYEAGYQAGYYVGRYCGQILKVYVFNKLIKNKIVTNTVLKGIEFSKCHQIDSKNAKIVTENVFECLQYLE